MEVVSPSESAEDVDEKVDTYLAAGTKTVLVVWPKTRHVMVHHRDGMVVKAGPGQYVEAPEVLPGIRMAVDSLFPAR
ncbi:MAG: Uma2 family endonuclease [Bryobacteraceae bacterium]